MIRRLFRHLQKSPSDHLKSRDAYAKWAANYPPTPHNVLMEIEQNVMLDVMPSLEDKIVLDLACGTGRYGLIALEQGAKSVFGVDDSFDMLKKSPLKQLTFGSMAQIPLQDACIDVVICGLAVGHFSDLNIILKEITRVLVKGGTAVISDFHPFLYLSGARRTFTHENIIYEVEHYPHLYESLMESTQQAGLSIQMIREPLLEGQSTPIVMVYVLQKI